MRKAVDNGYCDECIQLNTKECNFCSSVKKNIILKSETERKSKHNFWIEGLEKGSDFFQYIFKLGAGIFYVVAFITLSWFWSSYLLGFPNETKFFSGVAILMLFLLRLVMFLVLGGLLFKYFCLFLAMFLRNKEEKVLLREGRKKYLK